MRTLRAWLMRAAGLFGSGARDRDLADEIESHLQLHIEDNIRAGLGPAEARRAALLKFGAVEEVKEQVRDRHGVPSVGHFARDVRYALRMMKKTPAFTTVAVAALALGIGVNTTVFSALNALALRPLDVVHPEQLARVYRSTRSDPYGALSYPDYLYYRDHARTISDLAVLAFGTSVTSTQVAASAPAPLPPVAGALGFHLPQVLQGTARPMSCAFVSGNYFRMLATAVPAGRALTPDDDHPGAPPVVMLSGNFWRRQFRADPAIIGSTLRLDGVPFTVVGVTPTDYVATAENVPDLWVPASARVPLGAATAAQIADPDVLGGWVEGRLAPGATLSGAQAELNALATRLRSLEPTSAHLSSAITIVSGRTYVPGLDAASWAVVIAALAAVLLLLLISCTNVASLLLARAAVRRREIAVRLALGSGRGRLVRQLLTESLVLAVLGGAAGLLASAWLLRLLVNEVAAALPEFWGTIALHTDPDWRVFAYALGVSGVAAVAFGLTPALQASRVDLSGSLKDEGGASDTRRSRGRVLGALVLMQVAACLVLLVSSAMLLRSSSAAVHADPGFDAAHVLLLQPFAASAQRVSAAATERVADDLRRLPGVRVVAEAAREPLHNGGAFVPIVKPGDTSGASSPDVPNRTFVQFNQVSPEYFQALGIPVTEGRTFTRDESEGSASVAIISEAMAARYFPHQPAIGQHLAILPPAANAHYASRLSTPPRTLVVVGVAADVRSLDLSRVDQAYLYLPLPPARRGSASILVRVARDPQALLPAVGGELRRVLPDVPVIAGPLDALVSFDPRFVVSRIGGALAAIVALFGLGLASLGVYGTVSYSVSQRAREIGIRMALGADVSGVLRLIIRDGARPVAWGVGAGLLLTALASKLLGSLLFGVGPFDVRSFVGASAVLVGVALVAIWLPARRATRVDPVVALRCE